MKVLHLGKFDGDVGGIERYLRALLGGCRRTLSQSISLPMTSLAPTSTASTVI